MRQARVDRLALEAEAELLHHAPRGEVVGQRERDDVGQGERAERDLERRGAELGRDALVQRSGTTVQPISTSSLPPT